MSRVSWAKPIAFRAAALIVGLAPLLLVEGACRLFDWGRPERYDDPFVGFSATRPLFVPTSDGARYEIAKNRLSHFQPDTFAAAKAPGEFRIFVLGGSTVQGRPYSIETSFTAWLELSLGAADPSRSWRVVNCGGVSYATYRLVPILEEVLNYQPDLVIFYEGHNEFLEDRTYGEIKHAPAWFTRVHETAASWRTYNLARATLRGGGTSAKPQPSIVLGPEADARLDWRGGLSAYHRDPAWQRHCIEHFEFNLRRLVAVAGSAGVPLLLVNPAYNLDWPPFKAESTEGLTLDQLRRVEQLRDDARMQYATDLRHAAELLKQAVAIDPRNAGILFDRGETLLSLGDFTTAREVLMRAKDEDVCPLRILSPMSAIVQRVAQETDTPLVDADALFTKVSRGRVTGPKWFVDHVHPTVEGHQLLADAIADEIVRLGYVRPNNQWATVRYRAYDEHLKSLPSSYFPDGAKLLKSEQGWARGQSPRVRPAADVE